MGRQVATKLSEEQEQALLTFLRKSADVALIRASAPTSDGIFHQHFAPRADWHWIYYLWNRAYPWVPEISEHQGHLLVGNTNAAPLIEYTRHNFGGSEPVGRIYWARDFVAPDGLSYDADSFNRWFDSVAGWVRRHGGAP